MSELPTFILERQFKAPRDLVWKAWTDAELLAKWYGPGVDTIIHELDVRVGGVWRNEMRMKGKDGSQMSDYSVMTFIEVEEGETITFELASTDADWNPCPSMMMPNWPRLFFTEFLFEDDVDNTTKVTLTQRPMNANDEEIAAFAGMIEHMGNGWGAGFNAIEDILMELQAS